MTELPYRSLIVFGGSFDPPHRAHIQLPLMARDRLDFEAVAFIPAAISPFKRDAPPAPAEHRLRMLELALADEPSAIILTDELDRSDNETPSYTIDTLEHLRDRLPRDATMRLLIGTDQLKRFDRWYRWRDIVSIAEPLVMIRPPHAHQSLSDYLPEGFGVAEWRGRFVELPIRDISGTEIRERIQAGQPIDHLVPRAVAEYIEANGLYQTPQP